jgi:hypothetical protein
VEPLGCYRTDSCLEYLASGLSLREWFPASFLGLIHVLQISGLETELVGEAVVNALRSVVYYRRRRVVPASYETQV